MQLSYIRRFITGFDLYMLLCLCIKQTITEIARRYSACLSVTIQCCMKTCNSSWADSDSWRCSLPVTTVTKPRSDIQDKYRL